MLATGEGTPFAVNEVFDAGELVGSLSASIDWGDGTVTSGGVSSRGGGSLVGRVDYGLDTNNFFDTQSKRDLFQLAVDTILSRLGDDLAAIVPSARNTWTAEFPHPGTGATHSITDLRVSANEIVIYAGGRDLGSMIASGGPGGFRASCIDPSFCEAVATRGEVGARIQTGGAPLTDFGPWGGAIAFDSTVDYYYAQSTVGLEPQQSDFLSVAMHEVAHLLGFGTSGAWTTYVSGNVFNGPASKAANGNQSVPLADGGGHWASGTTSDGMEAALDASLTNGTRKLFTSLDFAGLDDVGWDLIASTASITASHTYADDGVYEFVATLAGSGGGVTSKNLQVTVSNVTPTLTAANDREVGIGQLFTISNIGVFTDPGFAASETFTYTVDWGDGSPLGGGTASIDAVGAPGIVTRGSFDAAHTYINGGIYTVLLTVSDDDGGTDNATLRLTAAEPGSTPSWHNTARPWDVNGDLIVSPIDVLQIVNDLNLRGPRKLPTPIFTDVPPYLDVNNDGFASPLDVLLVVNLLNAGNANSEGEAVPCDLPACRTKSVSPIATIVTADSVAANQRRSIVARRAPARNQFADLLTDDLVADIAAALAQRA